MNGAVDVLAVQDKVLAYLYLASNRDAQSRLDPMSNSMSARAHNLIEDAIEARVAAAELIEACKYMSSHSDVSHWSLFHAALANVGSVS